MTTREFFLLFAKQSGDILNCLNKACEKNDQSWRRIYARAVFFIIEWSIIHMKNIAVEKHKVKSNRCCMAAISYLEIDKDWTNVKFIRDSNKINELKHNGA